MEPELEPSELEFLALSRANADKARMEQGLPPWDWSLPFGPPSDLQGDPPVLADVRFRLGSQGVEASMPQCRACRDGRYSVWDGDPAQAPQQRECPHVRLKHGVIAFGDAGIPAIGGQIGLSLVDGNFAWKRLENADATKSTILAWCESLERFVAEPRLLLLWGPTGSGKTHLAAGVAHWACFHVERRVSVRWLRWRDYLDLCRLDRTRRDQARAAGLLVIDELSNSGGAWGASELEDLVDHRMGAGRATVITTNLDPRERDGIDDTSLRCMGERAYSRLAGFGTLVAVGARDYRLRGKGKGAR